MNCAKKNIITKNRIEIYKDFAMNLLYYINYYYLDKNTLSEDIDIANHYDWCFNKVCDEFKEENIDFSTNEELKKYYFTYYYHGFYKCNVIQDISLDYFEKFWRNVFDIEKQKNKDFINILINIYEIYDKSINHRKNILEVN
jgi:hypothetical protein